MEPLASRIRPAELEEFVGQEHLTGKGKPLRVAIEKKELFSFIMWGPPGSGKTTLARIYANAVGADFYELSAVDAGKEDIKRVLGRNPKDGPWGISKGPSLGFGKPRILFVDEIHRFNKAQQDFLLPFVERGELTLIGATTENPSFEVIAPLLSRCRVFVLNEHSEKEMEQILKRTKLKIPRDAKDWLVRMAGGDARQAITTLETTQALYGKITIETLKEALQSKHLRYDKKGEEHYNTISAFIKSMRASQPDAALYYLARMVEAGEDPKFIARRMVVFASEDIGLAQPTALVVANAVFEAVNKIGYPEATINLAHGVAYLAQCKKDRRAYDAIFEALDDVKKYGNLPIPLKVRNAPTRLMKELKYGKGYEMYPSTKLGTGDQGSYLPDKLKKKKYLQ
ncbi:AAA family ATPase [Candidatus Kaiserbacteria bacterium RIFCSPHIGHO2_02_FULL_59_21]|uniref:AAA family ATPase n=1 Tax=Candidatus Kaiserbacteria bacterium RIFCSPHIGHO2_02_FULL_59_21 TaxID=1798500 RepID=A0A1F6E0F9_9BACT|nr:MAG: AAA family ATPase [Candidatus Kaiserbacteria bacterium RIFCSPHIGHO2_02_FULL_59_21]OGG78929.1 MAG: AAA family ATPase [Candidatus Kaiserbacteria bacterium RIFCSPLOWO2_01_FULL_59_34]OGG86327.1 MAG: AAA family ATPase [Candidatus Kaiserbacteria bacterium RIFCSPLOWO2_02_FULL_59_19]